MSKRKAWAIVRDRKIDCAHIYAKKKEATETYQPEWGEKVERVEVRTIPRASKRRGDG